METTLYDDNMTSVKKMKTNMTLDLNVNPAGKQDKFNEILGTPDLSLFMLASPDLERFIIQQNCLVLTTPTPTSQILCPKTVTEEQEAYARGFVDALGELHKNYGVPPLAAAASLSSHQAASNASRMTTSVMQPTSQSLTTTTVLPGNVLMQPPQINPVFLIPSTVATSVVQQNRITSQQQTRQQPPLPFTVKMETAQMVPSLKNSLHPISPINMDDQEQAKLERKRARNRVAATRCRNRKLERISRLEERVNELKDQNVNLAQTASALRDQVCRLKQNIIEHTQQGCQVMLTHNLL